MKTLNPLVQARKDKGLSRPQFAMLVGLGYTQIASAESGHHQKLPEHWRANFESAGLKFDDLSSSYLAWREARIAELREAAAHA